MSSMNRDYMNNRTDNFALYQNERRVSDNDSRERRSMQQVPQSLRRKSKNAIIICYCCMVVLEIALVIGAILISISVSVGDKKSLVDYAGSYTVIQLQQSEIDQKILKLSETYRFDETVINKSINVAALSQYSQKTIEYWFDLLHGKSNLIKPTWETDTIKMAIKEDPKFQGGWLASELSIKVDEAAKAISEAITVSVFPIEPLPLTLGFLFVNNQHYINHISVAAWIVMVCSVIIVGIIRIAQNTRPFQSFWFYGVSLMTGFLILSIFITMLQNQNLEEMFRAHNSILAFYATSILTLFETYLRAFSFGFFVAGAVLLTLFFSMRYQRQHSMHHELSTFF